MTDVRFDAQIFEAQARGGISRYFVELMREFEADPALGVVPSTPFLRARNEHLAEAYPGRYVTAPPYGRLRATLMRPFIPRPPDADVVHFTFYDPAYLDSAKSLPTVSTVHDMIPELVPDAFPAGSPHRAKREYVQRSTGIICVSETTCRDLRALYGDLVPDLVAIVPHGVSDAFRHPSPPTVVLPPRYVLFVGQRGGYKDWQVLVEAWRGASFDDDVELVCVGGGAFLESEQALLAEHGLTDRATQLTVADADLPGVYAGAELFVFPSRYEGFGMPLLEAFAAGCPVVLADTDCFREVADTAGSFFAPEDPTELAGRMAELIGDRALRTRRIDDGRLRAADFTWRRTAELTADFYRQVIA